MRSGCTHQKGVFSKSIEPWVSAYLKSTKNVENQYVIAILHRRDLKTYVEGLRCLTAMLQSRVDYHIIGCCLERAIQIAELSAELISRVWWSRRRIQYDSQRMLSDWVKVWRKIAKSLIQKEWNHRLMALPQDSAGTLMFRWKDLYCVNHMRAYKFLRPVCLTDSRILCWMNDGRYLNKTLDADSSFLVGWLNGTVMMTWRSDVPHLFS
jgi:hypothetical protein